ncbi:MAG TPA: hypothetical protein VE933_12650 [Chitinophagaceae bacterium]|nr:hypothetical protein [Chitinophagaceae bacterium]
MPQQLFLSMKYCFVLLLLSPFFSSAQDCNLKTTKDAYTREVKLSTGLVSLNNAQYSIQATKSEIDFMFSVEGKCFDDASTGSVFFEGTRLKSNFKNSGTTNCDGLFHFTFRNTNPSPSALSNLGTKKITSIRFKDNTNKETGIILTAEQQQTLSDLINCIINEAKKLQ